jgi:hypothetical protein
VVFLFVGSERLPAIIYGKYGQTLNVVQKVTLDYLVEKAFQSLVRDPTSDVLEWEDGSVQEVAVWSARNPFFATLICAGIWNNAVRDRDYYVAPRDVFRAVSEVAETADSNYFAHFWADSPRPEDEMRSLEETKSARIVVALSHASGRQQASCL